MWRLFFLIFTSKQILHPLSFITSSKNACQSTQNDLAMVFINCYYFLTVSCLPASVVHVGSNDVFVKPFSNFATIVPPRRKSTISVAKVPITSQQKYQMVQMLPKIGEIRQQKYHAYSYYYYYYYYYYCYSFLLHWQSYKHFL